MNMNHRLLLLTLPIIMLTACDAPKDLEIKPAPTVASKERSLLRIAKATEAAGDSAAALDLYQQVARQTPDSLAAWVGQARMFQQLGETDAAISAFEKALEQDSDNASILRQLAGTLIYAGNPEQAIVYLETAESNDPGDARILNAKGVALDMLNRYSEAQDTYRSAIDKETGSRTYIENNLAMSYLLTEEYDKAITILSKLLSTKKDNARLRQNLALAYGLKGDHKKALKLGLKDLPQEAVEENIDFYKTYTKKLNRLAPSAAAPADKTPTTVVTEEPAASTTDADIDPVPTIAEEIPDTSDAVVVETTASNTPAISAEDDSSFTVEEDEFSK